MNKIIITAFISALFLASPVFAQRITKKSPALSAEELQKRAEAVYSEMQNQVDIAPPEVKLLKSQAEAKKVDSTKRIQEVLSGSDDGLQQIYKSTLSVTTGTTQPVAEPVVTAQPQAVQDTRSVSPRSSRLDSWVQRGSAPAVEPVVNPSIEDNLSDSIPAQNSNSAQNLFQQINDAASQDVQLPQLPVAQPL